MWSADLYLGSVTLPSNNWLMVYGDFESRSHQFPWVWRLPHYLRPFTAALRKFYSQIRWNKVFSKKIIFGVWSSGSRRLDGHLLHWKGEWEASDNYRTQTAFRLPPSVRQGWVIRRSYVKKQTTATTNLSLQGRVGLSFLVGHGGIGYWCLCWHRGYEHIYFLSFIQSKSCLDSLQESPGRLPNKYSLLLRNRTQFYLRQ